jgi:hypothetical protein
MAAHAPHTPPVPVYETPIPTDLLPPLPPFELPPNVEEGAFDEARWTDAAGMTAESLSGEVVIDPADDWSVPAELAPGEQAAPSNDALLPPDADAHEARWVAIRDANIRPYADWRPGAPVALPPLVARPGQNGARGPQPQQHAGGHHGRPGGHPGHNGQGPRDGGGGGRRRRRGRDHERERGGGGGGDRHRHDRHRERGPRLPGFYNPGGD